MPNWNDTMFQTFEYYKVDPNTWKDQEPITDIIDSRIDRDSGADTTGSASFTTNRLLGECYIRVYLITVQNGFREKFPLGTYLIQTPSYSFDGKVSNVTLDAYTPLIELKERPPALGYFIPKDKNILEEVYGRIKDNVRAPVVMAKSSDIVPYNFVSDINDTWMSYLSDLLRLSNHTLEIDEMGRILFKPNQIMESIQPTWIYDDNNSSILYPAVSIDNDLYGIPNVVEVVYSTDKHHFHVRVENNDVDSPISISKRGREIVHRVSNPEISGTPSESKIQRYAERLLTDLSSLEYTISYSHGYCPVRVGDCVILNYRNAGLRNVKAKVITQSISCVPGTPVEEKAVFTNKLWEVK